MKHLLHRFGVRIGIGLLLIIVAGVGIFAYMPYQRDLRIARRIESLGGKPLLAYRGPDVIPQSMRDVLPFLQRLEGVIVYSNSELLFSEIESAGIRAVNLMGPNVTDECIPQINRLTHAVALNFNNSNLTNAGLEQLTGIMHATVLLLENTQVTEEGLKHLKRLTSLNHLSLSSTSAKGHGLMHLKNLSNLAVLQLRNTQLTDDDLKHLEGLVNLKWLDLSDTKTTSEGRARLRAALPSCRIDPLP